jgi:serine/threonine protein kinase
MKRKSSYHKKPNAMPSPKDASVMLYTKEENCGPQEAKFEDFKIVRLIGRGTFGKVYLVKCEKSGKLFAMKSIRKDIVIEHDSLASLKVEKLILLQVRHPFIISMDHVFAKATRIYFIMAFVQGGELFKHLSEQRRFSESRVKFYAA